MIRDWTFVVFKIEGRGLADEVKHSLKRLDESEIPETAAICVRAQQDGAVHDFDVAHQGRHRLQPRTATTPDMLSATAISDFLQQAATRFPAHHYFVSFEGHSHQIRQVIGPIHQALQRFGKVDVLAFDSCFLAQMETAAEFRDVAHTLLASQEGVSGTRPVEQAARYTPLNPQQMAAWFVAHHQDTTFSAMDLDQWSSLEQPMRHLSRELLHLRDPAFMARVRDAVRGAQHFYTEGIDGPHPFHNTVDLVDTVCRIRRVASHDGYRKLRQACDALLRQVPKLVLAEKHVSQLERTPLLDYTLVSHACGLSLFWPVTPPGLRDEYTRFAYGAFERRIGWDRVVQHLTASKDPTYVAASVADYVGGQALSTMGNVLEETLTG